MVVEGVGTHGAEKGAGGGIEVGDVFEEEEDDPGGEGFTMSAMVEATEGDVCVDE